MGLLGTSAVVTDLGILATADVVADMNVLATADVVADMNTLATSDIVADLNTLATSDIVTDMNLLATSANVTAMGLLGTSAVVTDMGLLGTSAVVTDLDLLATSANVTAMGLLGNSATVTDLGILGTSAIVSDLSDVADNIAGVNSFADRYRVASSAPGSSLDEGDLYFNTTANSFNHYNGSAWVAIQTYSVQDGELSQNSFTDADHTKLNAIEASATADQSNAEIKTAVEAGTDFALGGNPTTTTQSASNNSTRIATTAYTDVAVANIVDSAPSTLNTLNELAAALGDDANYATTTTNAIAAKLPLAGGTMTGALILSGNPASSTHASNKAYVDAQILTVPDAVAMSIALG
jgi:hypothetical protein